MPSRAVRREGSPFGRVFVPMLSHHPDCAFAHLREYLSDLGLFSILSREGVRTIPGPIRNPVGAEASVFTVPDRQFNG
jgi:hypothetical protein